MDIAKAVKLACQKDKYITRANNELWQGGRIKIRPTNTPECCIGHFEGGHTAPRWNPNADDLTAEDWELAD